MKKFLKRATLLVVLLAIVGIASALIFVSTALPDVGEAPELTIEITPERLERGEYLANHVMLCMDCHSERDWTLFSGPPKPGTAGVGGEIFGDDMGFPGRYVSRNITPHGVGEWTDGELFRAITTGVSRDGSALFPIMPYSLYGQLDKEDIYAVIAYVRSLDPVERELEASSSDFPMNFIINTIPQSAKLSKRPEKTNLLAYGEYMAKASGCVMCHTKEVKGERVGEPYAGGFEFKFPDGAILRSSNITPHETGIATWTKEAFVNRFKQYADSSYSPDKILPGQFQTMMPWMMYAGMEEYDLEAIYAFLQTLPAVENRVVRFSPASPGN